MKCNVATYADPRSATHIMNITAAVNTLTSHGIFLIAVMIAKELYSLLHNGEPSVIGLVDFESKLSSISSVCNNRGWLNFSPCIAMKCLQPVDQL